MIWQLAGNVTVCLVVIVIALLFERSRPPSRTVALIAALAALAAIARIIFAPLPNMKPTTDLVLFTGFSLGPIAGFATGAIAAVTSNFVFGQGPWTIWQMFAWGIVGAIGGVLRYWLRRVPSRIILASICAVAGLIYGTIMNLSIWTTYVGDHSLVSFLSVAGTSLPFDISHAVGNLVFCLICGPAVIHTITRFGERLTVQFE